MKLVRLHVLVSWNYLMPICFEVGVEDAEDRKKLYFLIQRLHTVHYHY